MASLPAVSAKASSLPRSEWMKEDLPKTGDANGFFGFGIMISSFAIDTDGDALKRKDSLCQNQIGLALRSPHEFPTINSTAACSLLRCLKTEKGL